MDPRINIITLGTHHLKKATRFYEHALGFPRMPFEGDIVFLFSRGVALQL